MKKTFKIIAESFPALVIIVFPIRVLAQIQTSEMTESQAYQSVKSSRLVPLITLLSSTTPMIVAKYNSIGESIDPSKIQFQKPRFAILPPPPGRSFPFVPTQYSCALIGTDNQSNFKEPGTSPYIMLIAVNYSQIYKSFSYNIEYGFDDVSSECDYFDEYSLKP